VISSIAFRTIVALCDIVGAGSSSLVIRGKALNTRSVGTRLSGLVESLTAFTAICRQISFVELPSSSLII
jgi:hypothetical protein